MEYFPENKEHISSFNNRLESFVKKGMDFLEKESINDEKTLKTKDKISYLNKELPEVFNKEIIQFLGSEITESEFEIFMTYIFHDYLSGASTSLDVLKDMSLDMVKNKIAYQNVRGYEHPDLEKREKENPIPTMEELMLGCYVEQIEKQTRQAVLVLRKKGYTTRQSGYYNKNTGSQFFDFENENHAKVPEDLIRSIKEKFDVVIDLKINNQIELLPEKRKTPDEWNECLNFFAEHMPIVDQETFATYSGSPDFVMEIKQNISFEDFIKIARNQKEKELLINLYSCKTEEEIIVLLRDYK